MKKLIFGVGLVLTVSVINLFNACSADEAEEAYMEQTSKKELLLAKSKEFAKKYKVEMWLNEENMDYIVRNLTIEQMEQDYIRESRRQPEVAYFEIPSNIKPGKLKFRTRSADREELMSFSGEKSEGFTVDSISGNVGFKWSYDGPSNRADASASYTYSYYVTVKDSDSNTSHKELRTKEGNILLSTSLSGVEVEDPRISANGSFQIHTHVYVRNKFVSLVATRAGGDPRVF